MTAATPRQVRELNQVKGAASELSAAAASAFVVKVASTVAVAAASTPVDAPAMTAAWTRRVTLENACACCGLDYLELVLARSLRDAVLRRTVPHHLSRCTL